MNKLFIAIIFCTTVLTSFSQDPNNRIRTFNYTEKSGEKFTIDVPFEGDKVVYSKVFDLEGFTADQIYARSRIALTSIFKSAKDVTQLEDPDNKIIIAQGWDMWSRKLNAFFIAELKIHFTMKIECRDNRYKVTIYDFKTHFVSNLQYQHIDLTLFEDDILKNCLNKKGELNLKTIYGMSFIAWDEKARGLLSITHDHIVKTDTNTSTDW